MKNQYLKLMAVLLITFPSLLGCRAAIKAFKSGPEVVETTIDVAKQGGRVLKTLDPSQVSRLKKSIRQAASLNIREEAINNGNKISKQKVEKHITEEISRQMKKMNLKRKLSRVEREEIEEEVEKDLEKEGITVTTD